MHIEDWDDRFLSEFDPEEYYKNLVRAKVRSAMIYFHSHVEYLQKQAVRYMYVSFQTRSRSTLRIATDTSALP